MAAMTELHWEQGFPTKGLDKNHQWFGGLGFGGWMFRIERKPIAFAEGWTFEVYRDYDHIGTADSLDAAKSLCTPTEG